MGTLPKISVCIYMTSTKGYLAGTTQIRRLRGKVRCGGSALLPRARAFSAGCGLGRGSGEPPAFTRQDGTWRTRTGVVPISTIARVCWWPGGVSLQARPGGDWLLSRADGAVDSRVQQQLVSRCLLPVSMAKTPIPPRPHLPPPPRHRHTHTHTPFILP